MGIRKSNNLDTAKPLVEILQYCPEDISKVYSKETVLNRPFYIAELNNSNKIHVHLRAYTDFYGGYAEHGRQILLGLNESGRCLVKLTPIVSFIDVDPLMHQKCSFYTRTPGWDISKSIYLTIAGPGWTQDKFCPKDRYSIGWTMIESLCCHPRMKEWLMSIKEIWAPTDTDVKRFTDLELPNIKKMHLGYNEKLYHSDVVPINIPDLCGRYVFGVVGSWNKRKGIKKIIKAFCRAFRPSDNVSLLMVCKYGTRPYNGIKDGEQVLLEQKEKWDIRYEFKKYIEEFREIPHVCLIDVPIHECVMPHVYAAINCGVGFSMGESTWLPGLEFFALGKPVIQLAAQTNGFIEYMNDGNSYLCKKVEYVTADEELYKGTSDYYENQQFADGDEFELAEMMQKVYFERESSNQNHKICRAFDEVKRWTWKQSIENVINRLKEIKK